MISESDDQQVRMNWSTAGTLPLGAPTHKTQIERANAVTLLRVRGAPVVGEALSALCDQLHRGSVWCVMVRFVPGLYTAIINCG